MGVTRLDDPLLTWCGNPLPEVCNNCSSPLPAPPGLFVYWAFVGAPLTQAGKVLRPRSDPSGMEADQFAERLSGCWGDVNDVSEDGPHIALCIPCAQKIGRDLLEDSGMAGYMQGDYPNSRRLEPEDKKWRGI